MQSITIYNDDPLFKKVAALLSTATPATGKQEVLFDASEEEEGSGQYASMTRPKLKREVRERGLLSRIGSSVTDDALRKMLEADDKSKGDEPEEDEEADEEEDDEEEEEEEKPKAKKKAAKKGAKKAGKKKAPVEEDEEEEEDEDEEEVEDEDEVALEPGMKVKCKIKGKTVAVVVDSIDYEAGKVLVKHGAKKYKVSPEALTI